MSSVSSTGTAPVTTPGYTSGSQGPTGPNDAGEEMAIKAKVALEQNGPSEDNSQGVSDTDAQSGASGASDLAHIFQKTNNSASQGGLPLSNEPSQSFQTSHSDAYTGASAALRNIALANGDASKITADDWKKLAQAFPNFTPSEQSAVKSALNQTFPGANTVSGIAGGDALQFAADGLKGGDVDAAKNRLANLQNKPGTIPTTSTGQSSASSAYTGAYAAIKNITLANGDASKISADDWKNLAKAFPNLTPSEQSSLKTALNQSFPGTNTKTGISGGDALQYAADGLRGGDGDAAKNRLNDLQKKP